MHSAILALANCLAALDVSIPQSGSNIFCHPPAEWKDLFKRELGGLPAGLEEAV